MIAVDDVTVAFETVTAIADIDLQIQPGEFVTIVGPSGCGKTTLLRVIGGLESPTDGTVAIDANEPSVRRDAGDIGFVFQDHTLLPWKTALENVQFLRRTAENHRTKNGPARCWNRSGSGSSLIRIRGRCPAA